MVDFLNAFERSADGSWTCVSRAVYANSEGRIQVMPGTRFTSGTSFMGVDLVEWLERQLELASRTAAKT